MKPIIPAIVMTISLLSCGSGSETATFRHSAKEVSISSDSIEQLIDSVYNRMTPGERLAQLQCAYLSEFFDADNKLDTAKCRRLIPNGIGHVPQYAGNSMESPEQLRDMVRQFQEWLMDNTPTGIPAMFHEEVLSGFCAYGSTIYPQQIGQACSFDTELAELKTRQTAEVMRKMGGTLSLSPMVDVVRNPHFNRLEESYGEDAYLSAAFGAAFARGLQMDGDLRNGVLTCSKHFLGYGGGGDADEKELFEEILLPHETMIRTAGNKVVMMGYHQVRDTFCTVNRWLMYDVLRGYLGFDGMIVTDYGAMNQPLISEDATERAVTAINSGMDVEFPVIGNYANLPQAMADGLVDEATFERAVKRVLRMKAATGLLDKDPVLYAEGPIAYDTPEEHQTAYDIAKESIVLLKNDDRTLPIAPGTRIALVGPNADSMWAMLGDYTYPSMQLFWRNLDTGNPGNQTPSLKEQMEALLPDGCTIACEAGCDWAEPAAKTTSGGGDERAYWLDKTRRVKRNEKFDMDAAVKLASESDVVVAAVGENIFLCGEDRDRDGLRLPGRQEEFVRRLIDTGKPVVLLMFGGRAMVIGDLADECAAIVHAWYPGEEGARAVADILYGNVNPSAKLSVSYPKVELNEPICYNTSNETGQRVQWPFGYGLSYTDYTYSNFGVDRQASTDTEAFDIRVDVTNTGDVAGDEVVQIYVSPTEGNTNLKPIKLAGFKRVSLAPGETKTVHFTMSPQQFGFWKDYSWHILPGTYNIKVGASSADIRGEQHITLIGNEVTMPLRTVYFTE